MDYTIENGIYYKVLDSQTSELITFGKLEGVDVLSTIHNVEWISESEHSQLKESTVKTPS